MRSGSVSATTFRKFISSLPFGGFQLMTFTYPHAWLSICLRWMSNGTVFLKRLSVKCTISYRFSVWSISIETWLLFLINVSSIVLVYINQLQLFKSNLWYSMYSAVFCVEYESFGIWTQVCNVGNTPSWIFNMLWICVCGNFLGGYFLPNFCWWGRAMLLWWWMAQRMKGNHFFSLAEYFSEY